MFNIWAILHFEAFTLFFVVVVNLQLSPFTRFLCVKLMPQNLRGCVHFFTNIMSAQREGGTVKLCFKVFPPVCINSPETHSEMPHEIFKICTARLPLES